jgi:hypothetical protein
MVDVERERRRLAHVMPYSTGEHMQGPIVPLL